MEPVTNFRLIDHAKAEMVRRQISEPDLARVLSAPEQTTTVREGREVYQSRMESGDLPKMYLLRVFLDADRDPPEVVTAYRTSRIQKYWRADL